MSNTYAQDIPVLSTNTFRLQTSVHSLRKSFVRLKILETFSTIKKRKKKRKNAEEEEEAHFSRT